MRTLDSENSYSYKKYINSEDGSILKKVHRFNQAREQHRAFFDIMYARVLKGSCKNQVFVGDPESISPKRMCMFGSNNYLGLTTHSRVKDAMLRAVDRYGVGSGGVPLLSGTLDIQRELEASIAKMKGTEAAIVFTSGYVANIGTVSGLVRKNNLILHDKLNHASIIDGSILSGAKFMRFSHNDPNSLRIKIEKIDKKFRGGILVAVDGVYSMDGDISPLDQLLPIVQEHSAILMVDDAHATGVLGRNGEGTKSHFGITDRNILITGTLSKALGTIGGFMAGSHELVEYLRMYARSNMFSTSLPPGVCGAAIESIHVMQETDLVANLRKNHEQVRSKLNRIGYDTGNSFHTAIIPVMIRNEDLLMRMSVDLYDSGIFVNAIKSPVVLPNQSRFRVSVMATHTREDIEHLLDCFGKIGKKYGVIG